MNLKFCVIGQKCYEFIRQGLKSEEILINKKLREKEDIFPFQNYDMIKGSTVPGDKGPSILPLIKYQNYLITANNKKSICIDLDTSEKLIEEYWKALAICHDCNIQNGEYIGMSPDNIELVKSARLQGFKFDESSSTSTLTLTYNDINTNTINNKDIKASMNNNNNYFNMNRNNSINSINKNNESLLTKTIHQQNFEKLCHIEFSSDRKRESVLVKEGNLYKLYVKGADSIIEELLDESTPPIVLEKSRYFVNLFSKEGYRTLYIAMRLLTEVEYEDFIFDLNKAQSEINNKKEKLDEVYASVEKNLTLLGATIVEDKLQENVPQVIKELREADIKIWMLTGDKLSTAYNIGLSCNLINKNIKTFFIEGVEKKVDDNLKVINLEEQEQVIIDFVKNYKQFIGEFENGFLLQNNKNIQTNDNSEKMKFGILVDEKALLTITENTQIEKMFLDVAKDAIAVICCRVSPLQKSQVVKLMKNYDKTKITLAIGDGGNDVSMIMEAHIGIGIYGEEGLRAAQSSDYAIGEFQVLRRLLFVHGYLNLMRNSMMIIYFFYKNFVYTIVHFFYGFINNFSGQTIIDDWFITLYNLLFTSIPLAGRCILDYSIKPDEGKIVDILIPFLYKEQRENPIFTIKSFLLNLLKGAIHSVINYYFTIAGIANIIDIEGYESNFWTISVILFTNVLLIVTIDLVIQMKFQNYIVWLLIIFLTFVLYIIFLIIVESFPIFNSFGTMKITFNSLIIWLNFLVVNGICALFDFAVLSAQSIFVDSLLNDVVLIKEKDNLMHDYLKTLPEKIKKLLTYKGFYLDNNDDKGNTKPKVNRTFKKHSSLRKDKVKRQKTNSVEFIGVDNIKEVEKDKEKYINNNKNTNIDNKDNDDNGINIYNRNKNNKKIIINNGNFKAQENKKLNLNINNNLILKKNMYLHNRESLLIDDKWPVKDNNNKINNGSKKIIKIKKNKNTNKNAVTNKNKKSKELEKKRVNIINKNKLLKEESQRGLIYTNNSIK
jgi:magnesium-transporting ATPase (P-type)